MQGTGAEQDWTCLGRADGCQLNLANCPSLIQRASCRSDSGMGERVHRHPERGWIRVQLM